MALPTTGQLSLFAIFKEIHGREPNVGERVSFHAMVAASKLADKSFPCPFSRFYGYSHGSDWVMQHAFVLSITPVQQVTKIACWIIADFKLNGVVTHSIRKDWSGLPINHVIDGEETIAPNISFNTVTVTFYSTVDLGIMDFRVIVVATLADQVSFTQDSAGNILLGTNTLSLNETIGSETSADGDPVVVAFDVLMDQTI